MNARIAFYAPLKPPGHPIPSGDREIARNLMKALRLAGCDPFVATEVISYQKRPSDELFATRKAACEAEARRLIDLWSSDPLSIPALWFTYHPYCKSPDWIGPVVSARFGIPYVTAEACRTRQDTDAEWAAGRASVQAGVRGAALNFCLKPSDEAYLATFLPDMARVARLLPFLDESEVAGRSDDDLAAPPSPGPPELLAVGMMRPGAKIESYRELAQVLEGMMEAPWTLSVVGDGPERGAVEAMFAFAGTRARFAGALPREDVLAMMRRADVFAWPGFREAIGMVYLEAQAAELPIVAFATAGVPIVVADGESGLLAPEGDIAVFRRNLRRLLASAGDRRAMGAAGRRNVLARHGLAAATATLKEGLRPLLGAGQSFRDTALA